MAAGESGAAVIGKSVQIRGEVNGSEDLVVDGVVEGTITLDILLASAKAERT